MGGLGNFSLAPLPSPTAGVGVNLVGDIFAALANKKQNDLNKQKLAAQQKQQADQDAQRLYGIWQQNPQIAQDKGFQNAITQVQKIRGLPVPDFSQPVPATQAMPGAQGGTVGAPASPTTQSANQLAPTTAPQATPPPGANNPAAVAATSQAVVQKIMQLVPYRQNPVAQKQIQQLVQQYGNIIPPQMKQHIALALQQPANSAPQAQGAYQPNSIPNLAAAKAIGAPPSGGLTPQQGMSAAPGSAQAGYAPQAPATQNSVGMNILETPQTLTPAQIFSDPNMSKMFNEAPSEGKRALAKALGVALPEEYLKLGPEYGPMERAQARNQVYMSLNNMANGTGMNAQTFTAWATANQPTLEAAGMDLQSIFAMNPQVVQQLSATAQAKIDEMKSMGLYREDQAKAMLEKLPYQISNMRSLDDLRKFQGQYDAERATVLPMQVQSQIDYRQRMADAAIQNAQTHLNALDEKVREFDQGGGNMKTYNTARSYVQALEGDARAADNEYQAMFRTVQNWQNNNPGQPVDGKTLAELQQYKKRADTARTVAAGYRKKLLQMGPAVFSSSGLPGVTKVIPPGGAGGAGGTGKTVVGSDGRTYQQLPSGKWEVIR